MRKGFTVWLTGLSGAGKSTIAQLLKSELEARNHDVELLDGDEVRKNLSSELGFSRKDRNANVRRIGWVAAMATRHGAAVIVAAISPYRELRAEVRSQVGSFVEIYVKCPLNILKHRDPKGLYGKAMTGDVKNFTGVSDPYEEPVNPDFIIDTSSESAIESTRRLIDVLSALGYTGAVQSPTSQIGFHGGRLIKREVKDDPTTELRLQAESLPSIQL